MHKYTFTGTGLSGPIITLKGLNMRALKFET